MFDEANSQSSDSDNFAHGQQLVWCGSQLLVGNILLSAEGRKLFKDWNR